MIKTSGANVSPREVETLLQTYDEVREAVVFGVPDEVKEEIVYAVVVPMEGMSIDSNRLLAKLREDISTYKVPSVIRVMAFDEIPRTDSGKPKKTQLRELVTSLSN
jgi:acyl-coenzyme A synthetase/AMP-(fatty) acid ligase